MLAAIVSGGAGVYLLRKQCNPTPVANPTPATDWSLIEDGSYTPGCTYTEITNRFQNHWRSAQNHYGLCVRSFGYSQFFGSSEEKIRSGKKGKDT